MKSILIILLILASNRLVCLKNTDTLDSKDATLDNEQETQDTAQNEKDWNDDFEKDQKLTNSDEEKNNQNVANEKANSDDIQKSDTHDAQVMNGNRGWKRRRRYRKRHRNFASHPMMMPFRNGEMMEMYKRNAFENPAFPRYMPYDETIMYPRSVYNNDFDMNVPSHQPCPYDNTAFDVQQTMQYPQQRTTNDDNAANALSNMPLDKNLLEAGSLPPRRYNFIKTNNMERVDLNDALRFRKTNLEAPIEQSRLTLVPHEREVMLAKFNVRNPSNAAALKNPKDTVETADSNIKSAPADTWSNRNANYNKRDESGNDSQGRKFLKKRRFRNHPRGLNHDRSRLKSEQHQYSPQSPDRRNSLYRRNEEELKASQEKQKRANLVGNKRDSSEMGCSKLEADCDEKPTNTGGDGQTTSSGGSRARPPTQSKSKQKATDIATKAAEDAKAASDAQSAAACAAAMQVKMQYAEKAIAAAKAAEAALAGKQDIVEQLQMEVQEAEEIVHEQTASLQNAQANVNSAVEAAQQAQNQLKQLIKAVETAKANVQNSDQAANGAQQELAEKMKLLEAAKSRVEMLLRQLQQARADFEKTKSAACKAAHAAHQAKVNANRSRRNIHLRKSRQVQRHRKHQT